MAIALRRKDDSNVVEVVVSGRLTHQDYVHFVPEVDAAVKKHGRIRLLLDMKEFRGWNAKALWDDTKFALKHYSHISRIAMVGESTWEKWMSNLCRPFTRAEVRYFDRPSIQEARRWMAEPRVSTPPEKEVQ